MFSRNKKHATSPAGGGGFASRLLNGGIIAFSLLFILMASEAQAATPLAGTVISNQATATYTDAANPGVLQTATSNTVQTTVEAVGAFTLLSDNSKVAAAGTTVYMPHVLTNTGNSPDTFTLSLPVALGADVASASIFMDANGDGQPDTTTPLCTNNGTATCAGITTGVVQPTGTYNFLVALVIKSGATNAAPYTEVVTATPTNTGIYPTGGTALTNGNGYGPTNKEKINTDTVTINNTTAVINVTKGITSALTSGPRGTQVTYRLSYTNSGNAPGPIQIVDAIGTSSMIGYNYVAGSASWTNSGTGLTTPLLDAGANNGIGIQYTATPLPVAAGQATAATATTITASVYSVPANSSGYFEFKVIVINTALTGISTTTNFANYNVPTLCAADTGATSACTAGTPIKTNLSPFIVTGFNYGVIANNSATSTADGDNVTPTGNDQVYVNSASPGQTISFANYIHNTGLVTDNFNISVGAITSGLTAFPAGTVFTLYKTDGTTLLADTNGDGIPDTGSLAANATYQVVLKATLPANAVAGAGPYTISKTATSVGDSTQSNTVFDQLGSITGTGLVLTTNGSGQIYPGGTIVYPHSLVNNGSTSCGLNAASAATNYSFTVTNSLAATNWQYTLYIDSNNNGVVDIAGDILIGGGVANGTVSILSSTAGVGTLLSTPGSNALPILVKVTSPSGATAADIDKITVTASANCSSATVTSTNQVNDTTTITLSEMRVVKQQAKTTWSAVTGCAPAPAVAAYATTPLTQKPGDCIWYKVIATNQGSQVANTVSINDSTPAFTTYNTGIACTNPVGTATGVVTVPAPAVGYVGAVNCATWTTVPPAAQVQLDFAVRINP